MSPHINPPLSTTPHKKIYIWKNREFADQLLTTPGVNDSIALIKDILVPNGIMPNKIGISQFEPNTIDVNLNSQAEVDAAYELLMVR